MQICREYDILIVEDDAYYWLQYATTNSTGSGSDTSSSSTDAAAPVPGLQLPPSFLSMDVDGRVVRLDTMAKLLGPGYRLGWLTAAPAAVERLALAVSGSSVGPNSFSQVRYCSLHGDQSIRLLLHAYCSLQPASSRTGTV